MTLAELQRTMSPDQIRFEVQRGGRFVRFQYCFSVLIMTFRRSTDIYFIKSGESAMSVSLPWTALSLLLGWWGFPWGFIYTPMVLAKNFSGGDDLTQAIMARLGGGIAVPPPPPPRF